MLLNAILMFAIFDLLMKVEITTRKTLHKKKRKKIIQNGDNKLNGYVLFYDKKYYTDNE
jgi:hypothetical protein